MNAPPDIRRPWLLAAVLTTWSAVVLAGFAGLFLYGRDEGQAATAPPRWPIGSPLPFAADRPTLVMIAHPECSCTRASIGELSWLMTRIGDGLRALAVFVDLDGMDSRGSDLWRSAARIENVTVVRDDGTESARFGAYTSGQVYLYGSDGALQFAGGITPSRGHAGDNVGRQRLLALVRDGRADRARAAVFGCGLSDADVRGPSSAGMP